MNFLLFLHNLVRWMVLILALLAIYYNYTGWKRSRKFTRKDKALNSTFIGTLHLQLLIGLGLYFMSNTIHEAWNNISIAMKDAYQRFWAIEHPVGMFLGIVVAQVGNIIAKKGHTDEVKFKRAFIFFLIAAIIILLSLPYVFRGGERPLNPFDRA
jgi:hypothetical protein